MTNRPTGNDELPLTNAVVVLNDQGENVYWLLGRVHFAILLSNHPELAAQFVDEALTGDADQLLSICFKYVTIE